jgi:hypothetical protein
MVADGFLQEVTERTESYQLADPFRLLQKETKVTKIHFPHTLHASFSWLSSVQISDSEQRLESEVIFSVSSVASCKSDAGVV